MILLTAGGLTIYTVILLTLSVPAYFLERGNCMAAWGEHSPQYSFFGGCTVLWGGERVPSKVVRQIGITQ